VRSFAKTSPAVNGGKGRVGGGRERVRTHTWSGASLGKCPFTCSLDKAVKSYPIHSQSKAPPGRCSVQACQDRSFCDLVQCRYGETMRS